MEEKALRSQADAGVREVYVLRVILYLVLRCWALANGDEWQACQGEGAFEKPLRNGEGRGALVAHLFPS